MKEVDEGKIEKIMEPEHGEKGLVGPNHGYGNDPAHDEGEQGPMVEQG